MNKLYYGDNLTVLRARSTMKVLTSFTLIRLSTAKRTTTFSFAALQGKNHERKSKPSMIRGTGETKRS